jgi:hypothetical protein
MKYTLAAAALACAMVAMMPTEASAWVCRARSPTGSWGVGWHNYSLGYAKRRALAECAVRTPRGFVCFITNCR